MNTVKLFANAENRRQMHTQYGSGLDLEVDWNGYTTSPVDTSAWTSALGSPALSGAAINAAETVTSVRAVLSEGVNRVINTVVFDDTSTAVRYFDIDAEGLT